MLLGGTAGLVGLTACQPARLMRRDPSRRLVLRVNLFGTAPYAPLIQMREHRLLEDAIPGMWVEWKVLPSVESVNEALRDGGIDIATGSPTALLAAREGGLLARVIGGISAAPCAVVGRPGLKSLGAIKRADRIVVPEENSFEASILQLAALRELGDARALDQNLTYRPHVEALPSLKQGKEFAAHVAVTPFLELELEGSGPERLIDSRELFGGLPTTALAYALPSLKDRAAPLIEAFTDALTEGARLAMADPVGTARMLSETEDLRIAPDRLGIAAGSFGLAAGRPAARRDTDRGAVAAHRPPPPDPDHLVGAGV